MGPWGSGIVCAAILAVCLVVLMQDCDGPEAGGAADGQEVGPHPPDAKIGEAIFRREAMCLTCHQLAGKGGQNGPPLDGVGKKFTELKGGREQARKFFHDHIVDPANNPGTLKKYYPFTQMPSFNSFGEGRIADICEYLLTLQEGGVEDPH